MESSDVLIALRSMLKETDRGLVLVAADFLDDSLERLIRAHFQNVLKANDDLFKPMRPLATLSAKQNLAYALGLISKDSYEDLCTLRWVRNQFAHSYTDRSLAEECFHHRIHGLHSWKLLTGGYRGLERDAVAFTTTWFCLACVSRSHQPEKEAIAPFMRIALIKNEDGTFRRCLVSAHAKLPKGSLIPRGPLAFQKMPELILRIEDLLAEDWKVDR